MAAAPLFHADMDSLKASVRLSDLPTSGDGYSIFLLSLGAVHAKLFERLGQTRIADIQATTEVCPPTSDAEADRLAMKVAESDLLLAELMYRLPFGAMDAVASGLEMFDKEAPFRMMTVDEIATLRAKLLENAEGILSGVTGNDGADSIRIINYGNECAPKQIFRQPNYMLDGRSVIWY